MSDTVRHDATEPTNAVGQPDGADAAPVEQPKRARKARSTSGASTENVRGNVRGRPFVKGDPRRARGGGKPGRSGRKPQAFRTFAVSLATDPEFQERLRLAAMSGDLAAMKLVIQYSEGMPTQQVDLTADVQVTQKLQFGDTEIEF